MDIAKSSLVGLMLENGEDDLAAILAVSVLPDTLDTDRDRETLSAMGIPIDELVAPVVPVAVIQCQETLDDPERTRRIENTISRRWADLVDTWTRR